MGLCRGAERNLRQLAEDEAVVGGVSGDAQQHRRSAGVQARERTFWVNLTVKVRSRRKSRDLHSGFRI